MVRGIWYERDTVNIVATMTGLVRTNQIPLVLGHALRREDWTAEKIYEAIENERNIGKKS